MIFTRPPHPPSPSTDDVGSQQARPPRADSPERGAERPAELAFLVNPRASPAGMAGAAFARGDAASPDYAIASVRDLFLDALDDADPARRLAIARHLLSCRNPLPSTTCAQLGLPSGSTYAAGAEAVLAHAPDRA